jgi:hypothetical protein
MVTGGNKGAARLSCSAVQKVIAQFPRSFFDAQSVFGGELCHIARTYAEGDRMFLTPVPHELLVPIRCGTESVVVVGSMGFIAGLP